MKNSTSISPESFNALLDWLSSDRETAGIKYEEIRRRLITFFRFRGLPDEDALTDEVINRVAAKIPYFYNAPDVKSITYFYAFAANVARESYRTKNWRNIQTLPEIDKVEPHPSELIEENQKKEILYDCLDECLDKLGEQERILILSYYSNIKTRKAARRLQLAQQLGISNVALRARISRIKHQLRRCVSNCLDDAK
jgi:RNA polymerase sigma factor (sigma-70 family)